MTTQNTVPSKVKSEQSRKRKRNDALKEDSAPEEVREKIMSLRLQSTGKENIDNNAEDKKEEVK
jgi:hypothetical protein